VGKKSDRKSNAAKGSSEGGEDIFPGCRKGGGAAASDNKNKHKWGRPGGEGKLMMKWEFINSVTIQLAKIVFQNFLCKEIKMKYAGNLTS